MNGCNLSVGFYVLKNGLPLYWYMDQRQAMTHAKQLKGTVHDAKTGKPVKETK